MLRKNNNLWYKIFFLIFAIFLYRLGSHIPIAFIDVKKLINSFEQSSNGIFNLINLFSGGALSRVSIFSLGVMPYISASILLQLFGAVWAPIKQLKKEGQYGQRKIMRFIRYLTLCISIFQAVIIARYLQNFMLVDYYLYYSVTISSLVCGSIFLMWLGEQITEKGIGNGISIIIFSGIVSNLPVSILNTFEKVRQNEIDLFGLFLLLFMIFFMIIFVVFFECAQRKILINYAKKQQGRKMYAAQQSYLPLKINLAGVIPPIFASSLILFPITFFQFFVEKYPDNNILNILLFSIAPGKPAYIFLYAFGIIFFCFFYTALVFNVKDTAENLKKSGGFISGIRPGLQTADLLGKIILRLTFIGSIYITFVSLVPEFLILFVGVPFYFGGTSLLIIVLVVLEFINQIQTHLLSQKYERLLRKTNF